VAFFSEGLRKKILRGIFLRRSAQENTAWLFSSEALRKKILRGIFHPKLCARKYYVAFFIRSSAQENTAWHFSPKACARKCHVAVFSEALRKKMPRAFFLHGTRRSHQNRYCKPN
jgi:hypothetical protein